MYKFVVNLDRCKDRMLFFDKSYTRWAAIDGAELSDDNPVLSKMISMYNIDPKQHRAKCGCFISHVNLLKHIFTNKLNNVIVVEDDAEQVNPLPIDMPNEFIYLGGFFAPKCFKDNLHLPEMKQGLMEVPENTKLLMTLSYYIPNWEVAEVIYDHIMSQNRYRAIDIMLNKVDIKRYLYFPACYVERPLVSTIREDKNKYSTKYYTWERNSTMFKVVIPSYQRYDKLCKFTLAYLAKHGITKNLIYIFIRNDDVDYDKYKSLEEQGYHVIASDVKGIGNTHNYITEYFRKGEYIIEIDDDLKKIVDNERKEILSFTDTFNTIIHKMNEEGVSYAGLYSVANPMFMSQCNQYTTDLRYMLGILRIRRICKDIILETNYAEDFENCILHYIRDKKILKCNHLAGVTTNYSAGGCDGDGRNIDTEKIDKQHLATKYPYHCKLFQRKNGRFDLRLKASANILTDC